MCSGDCYYLVRPSVFQRALKSWVFIHLGMAHCWRGVFLVIPSLQGWQIINSSLLSSVLSTWVWVWTLPRREGGAIPFQILPSYLTTRRVQQRFLYSPGNPLAGSPHSSLWGPPSISFSLTFLTVPNTWSFLRPLAGIINWKFDWICVEKILFFSGQFFIYLI
jgi:hypothetical protein